MIIYERNKKELDVPTGLGNLNPTNQGGGVTPGEVQAIVNDAISNYDENTVEPKFGDYTPTENFATINGSAITAGGNIIIEGGGGKTKYFLDDMSNADRAQLFQALSAITSGTSVSGVTDVLSNMEFYVAGEVDGQKWAPAYFCNWDEGRANFNSLRAAKIGYPSESLRFCAWINPDGTYHISKGEPTIAPATDRKLGGVKIGAGLTIDSGGTLSAAGGGATQYILNKMTQFELTALYNELSAYGVEGGYWGISSAFPASNYAFYVYLGREYDWNPINDGNVGTVPMYLAMIHPSDYGGAVIFEGVVCDRRGYINSIYGLRFIVTSSGEIDKSTFAISPAISEDIDINVDSAGTIGNVSTIQGDFSSLVRFNRIRLKYTDGVYSSSTPLDYFYRQMEQIGGESKLVQYFGGSVWANGVHYKGTWHFVEFDTGNPVVADTWTVIS